MAGNLNPEARERPARAGVLAAFRNEEAVGAIAVDVKALGCAADAAQIITITTYADRPSLDGWRDLRCDASTPITATGAYVFGDDFVITETGVFGLGLNVNYVAVESLTVDGAEGDDRFYVLGTGPGLTTVVGDQGGQALGIGTRGASLSIARLRPGMTTRLPDAARQHARKIAAHAEEAAQRRLLGLLGVDHEERAVLGLHERGDLAHQHARDGLEVELALHEARHAREVGLQPVLLGVGLGGDDHCVVQVLPGGCDGGPGRDLINSANSELEWGQWHAADGSVLSQTQWVEQNEGGDAPSDATGAPADTEGDDDPPVHGRRVYPGNSSVPNRKLRPGCASSARP